MEAPPKLCLPCDSTCLSCSGPNPTNCLSCGADRFFKPDTFDCLTACPTQNYYTDLAQRRCLPCHVDCLECTAGSNTSCSICANSFFLYVDSTQLCSATCNPAGFFPMGSPNRCFRCHPFCTACSGALSTQCSACLVPYFHQPDTTSCLEVCPVERYYIDGYNCLRCHEFCLTCSGPGID